jgi:lipopolysaccharide assembly LptE-like protein
VKPLAGRVSGLALALLLTGCGYSLVGRGVAVDPTIKRVGVPVFKDDTGRPGLDQKVTQKVVEELLKRGKYDVVPDATGVDAIVEGEILSYRAVPIGFSQQGTGAATSTQAGRYSVILVARVKYRKIGATQSIWENDAVTVRDESDVGDSSATFFDKEDQVVERLSIAFARTLVSTMLEAF